jgi:hypothetical protein
MTSGCFRLNICYIAVSGAMNGGFTFNHREDHGPWFVVGGHPVYAPAALVGLGILSMLATTLALAFNQGWGDTLKFSSEAVLSRGEVWRAASYALWNPPSIGFALEMLMLWWFGRELEGYFGRRAFLKLYGGALLVPPVTALLFAPIMHTQWIGLPSSFTLFVAYATMSPSVSLLFGISAKWTALIFLGIQTLSYAAAHDWGHLGISLASAAFAFGFVRHEQGIWELPRIRVPRRQPQLRVLEKVAHSEPAATSKASPPSPQATQTGKIPPRVGNPRTESPAMTAIDPLLEKIGRSGLSSLTAEEKQRLQEAREALLKEGRSR